MCCKAFRCIIPSFCPPGIHNPVWESQATKLTLTLMEGRRKAVIWVMALNFHYNIDEILCLVLISPMDDEPPRSPFEES